MKRAIRGAGLAGLFLALTFAGCTPKTQPEETTSGAPKVDPNAVLLGESNTAGPFQVTLKAQETPVKVGDVNFTADVMEIVEPAKNAVVQVDDATVTVTLSMPTMGMPGPSAPLKWDGTSYVGTVTAGMGGAWQADVTVESGGATGKAAFSFNVIE